MTRKQALDKLRAFGLKLDQRDQLCVEQFCVEMKFKQYGIEETADAFLWFECGWKRAVATETNAPNSKGLNVRWRENYASKKGASDVKHTSADS